MTDTNEQQPDEWTEGMAKAHAAGTHEGVEPYWGKWGCEACAARLR